MINKGIDVEEEQREEEYLEKRKFSLKEFYDKQYKKLLIFPILLLVLAIGQIAFQTASTGDFINKGVSLKGGLTISIDRVIDISSLQDYLSERFPEADISVRALSMAGSQIGIIVEASDVKADELVKFLEKKLELTKEQYSVEVMGSSLGASFFRETFRALILAFLFMGIVVFLYFGENLKSKLMAVTLTILAMPVVYLSTSLLMRIFSLILITALIYIYFRYSIPSFAVVLAALSDIVITLAIVNMLGMRLSTASIAAFLMLIGYSVDTDILLSVKVLRRKEGSILDGILSAMKTGLMMNITTLAAIIIALSFAQSEILKQIMVILLIGLLVDLPNTWIQNAGILRWYLEKKGKKQHEA